ncbi:phage portal protein [Thomasclavelia cocleata]|uniref:phage portal protein n=1 Tax=Thomasclavelia cocleata TaxID=69824 RepID=UPI0025704ADD|nr:phage portal protein [Thomasclavelia cocleata]
MFNAIKNVIERIKSMMFPTKDIEKYLNIEIAVSNTMSNSIELWKKILSGKAPWINKEKGVFSLNIANAVCKELADTSTNELVSTISGNDFINEQYQYLIKNINDWLQWGLGDGGIALKPYISNNQIIIDYIRADMFFPVEFNNRKEITAAVFLEQISKGKYIYSRLEYQKYENGLHSFDNYAFVRKTDNREVNFNQYSDLGNQIDLHSVSEWMDLETHYEIGNINKPLFAYFKVPGINTVDFTSPLGTPCYETAINLIKEAEKQYSRYLWEYEGGELAIDASADLFDIEKGTNKLVLPEGQDRLFRTYDYDVSVGAGGNNKFINAFAPTLRDESYARGFNNILKRIEFNCGLSYGDLSDPQTVEKTAEEIKSSKQRKYNTVTAIQNELDNVFEHIAYILNIYAIGLGKANAMNISLENDWGDSVLVDSEKQRNIDLQEVNAGLMPEWKYKMKWQGLTEQQAKAEVTELSGNGLEYDDDEE